MEAWKCNKCGRILPLEPFYFARKSSHKETGFHYTCKECDGSKFGLRGKDAIVDGKMRCTECQKEYPATEDYFHVSRTKSGNRFVRRCKLCLRKDKQKREPGRNVRIFKEFPKRHDTEKRKDLFDTGYFRCAACQKIHRVSNAAPAPKNKIPTYCKSCRRELSWFRERIRNNAGWLAYDFSGTVVASRQMTEVWYLNTKQKEVHYRKLQKRWIKSASEKFSKDLKNNPELRLIHYMRRRIKDAIRCDSGEKLYKTNEYLGCSPAFLKDYLESMFEPWMNWGNYGLGGWTVDHIRPCSSFDLSDEKQQRECFNYSNLQPLSASENSRKNSWYNGKFRHKS